MGFNSCKNSFQKKKKKKNFLDPTISIRNKLNNFFAKMIEKIGPGKKLLQKYFFYFLAQGSVGGGTFCLLFWNLHISKLKIHRS